MGSSKRTLKMNEQTSERVFPCVYIYNAKNIIRVYYGYYHYVI